MGRIKIIYELKAKQISQINIKRALAQIDEDEYLKTLENNMKHISKSRKVSNN